MDRLSVKKHPEDHGISSHIVDLLKPWAHVEARRMFGGYGLFSRERMFALILEDILYLKDSLDENGNSVQTPFTKEYFEYARLDRVVRLSFFKAPERALEDAEFLSDLAENAWQSATVKKKKLGSKTKLRSAKAPAGKAKKRRGKPPDSVLKSPYL